MSAKDRPRLGRGLRGLISSPPQPLPDTSSTAPAPVTPQPPTSGMHAIPLHLIDPNPHQPRENMDPLALAELAASIRRSGVLQPVLLRPRGERFQLVAGHRRTQAAKQAGLSLIPAIVRSDTTEETQAEWALIENIQRQDLNPIERARAYRTYLEQFHLTHAQAAERLAEERTVITNFLRLLDLNPGVQDLIARGLLSAGHGKVLAGLTDATRQDQLANRAVADGLSVRKLEELLASTPLPPVAETTETSVAAHTRTLTAKSPHILELEQELGHKIGTRVRIVPAKKKNSGKIIIQYFSLDDFDRIVEKFDKP